MTITEATTKILNNEAIQNIQGTIHKYVVLNGIEEKGKQTQSTKANA